MKFQPYNNIIINIIIEIFFMYSMRFRFTEYLNTWILECRTIFHKNLCLSNKNRYFARESKNKFVKQLNEYN